MRRIDPKLVAAALIGLAVLLVVVLMLTRRGSAEQDTPNSNQAAATAASDPEERCASQATYDRIKVELFRQAAQVRKSDHAAFDRLATYASVRMERPLLRKHDEELGTIRCSGRLSLDLPPNVAVVGGRRTLSADIDYVLQPAADGSGDVVMLEGVDPIVIPLATLAGTQAPTPQPGIFLGNELAPGSPIEPQVVPFPEYPPGQPGVRVPPTPPSTATARPSFNCRYARTRGEIAVCGDAGLASLDRQMAAQYYRALSVSTPRQRQLLRSTRDSFIRYRDNCPTNACIAETYRGRMREIRDILSGEWRPGG